MTYEILLRRRLPSGGLREARYKLQREGRAPLPIGEEAKILADLEYQANASTTTITGEPFVRVHVSEAKEA